jgi:hypothetical protein
MTFYSVGEICATAKLQSGTQPRQCVLGARGYGIGTFVEGKPRAPREFAKIADNAKPERSPSSPPRTTPYNLSPRNSTGMKCRGIMTTPRKRPSGSNRSLAPHEVVDDGRAKPDGYQREETHHPFVIGFFIDTTKTDVHFSGCSNSSRVLRSTTSTPRNFYIAQGGITTCPPDQENRQTRLVVCHRTAHWGRAIPTRVVDVGPARTSVR